MKKSDRILVLFLCVVFVLCTIGLVTILVRDDIVIERYTATIDIDEYGNISVSETFDINYRKKYNERWRDILVDKNHRDNPLFEGISSSLYRDDVPVFESGKVVAVSKEGIDITENVRRGYSYNNDVDKEGALIKPFEGKGESLYVDATDAGGLYGLMTFVYEFQINGMVTCYNDVAELNYKLLSYNEGKIKNAAITVNIVKDTSQLDEELFYSFGHGTLNAKIVQAINKKNTVVQADYEITAKNVKSTDYIELRLLFPQDVVSSVDNSHIVAANMKDKILTYEYKLQDETRRQSIAAIIINVITILAVVVTGGLIIIAYKKYDKEYTSVFNGEYYRELPNKERTPAEMSFLYYFGKTNDEDVTATLLDLIRRKVLVLDTGSESINEKDPNFVIYLNKESDEINNLKLHERKLINWFIGVIGDKEKVTFKEIETFGSKSYSNAQLFQQKGLEFKKAVKEVCKNHNFFDKFSIVGKQKSLLKGAIIIAMLVVCLGVSALFNVDMSINIFIMIVLLAIYFVYIGSIKKRSVEGNEEYAKWKAFKKFLEEFSSFEDYPIPGVVVWEEYLVYATSFKIADKVMEQLEVKLPEYNETESTYLRRHYYGYSYHPYFYIRSFNNTMTTARRNTLSTINAHSSSLRGGSGRGGGFSGGTSFGGGGGGGRSR